jgi:transcriptional regulator with XRE-family HTH domain
MSSAKPSPRDSISRSFAQMCLDTRLALDVTQQQLASRVGVSRSYVGRIERGIANPSIRLVESMASTLGIELELVARRPVVHEPRQPRDVVHARCSAYADRRLRALGLETAREVEVVHGRSHGWIDLLAFDRRRGTLLLIEVKTRLDDLGAVERQLSWYERSVWPIARELGWSPRRTRSWLLVLASEEIEASLRANRGLFERAFPTRAPVMLLEVGGALVPDQNGRGLAMIDPSNRGRQWLLRTRLDGRRSTARYAGYAEAARR